MPSQIGTTTGKAAAARPGLQTLAATITGIDRPGMTVQLMDAIARAGAEVLDFEQVVVREQLILALLLGGSLPADFSELTDRLAGTCARLGLSLHISEGMGDNPPRPKRVVVTLLGRPLLARHVAAAAQVITDHGGNIDRSRRLSRQPMTTIEFWVCTTLETVPTTGAVPSMVTTEVFLINGNSLNDGTPAELIVSLVSMRG